MFGKKRKEKAARQAAMETIANSKSFTVKTEKGEFDTRNNATQTIIVNGIRKAYAYLYAAMHLDHVSNISMMVYNPNPSEPTGEYLFPADLFLIPESQALEQMKCSDFLIFCENLVRNRGVLDIGGVVSLNDEGTSKMSVAVEHDPNYKESGIKIVFNIIGTDKSENNRQMAHLLERIEKYQARCLEHSL